MVGFPTSPPLQVTSQRPCPHVTTVFAEHAPGPQVTRHSPSPQTTRVSEQAPSPSHETSHRGAFAGQRMVLSEQFSVPFGLHSKKQLVVPCIGSWQTTSSVIIMTPPQIPAPGQPTLHV